MQDLKKWAKRVWLWLNKLRYEVYMRYAARVRRWGARHGCVALYGDTLIERLRELMWGGLPASIVLLTRGLCNGHCLDRALLMAQAFLDMPGEVRLIYANIEQLRIQNILQECAGENAALHCVVEWREPDGKCWIFDTSAGFAMRRWLYWLSEFPGVIQTRNREEIRVGFELLSEGDFGAEELMDGKYVAALVLPWIEEVYGDPLEPYGDPEKGALKQEIELFKAKIDYDKVKAAVDYDIEHMFEPGFTPTIV